MECRQNVENTEVLVEYPARVVEAPSKIVPSSQRHFHKMATDPRTSRATPLSIPVPVESLPDELLLDIFEYAQHSNSRGKCVLPTEVLISHVSRRWRQLAVDNPKLWTQLVVTSQMPSDRISTYLARSGQCLLDISFELLSRVLASTRTNLSIMDTLMHHAERWRTFVFNGKITNLIIVHPHSPAPHLESFRIRSLGAAPGGLKPAVTMTTMWSWLSIALANLTTIEVCVPYWQTKTSFTDFRRVMSASPSLRHLALRGCLIEMEPGFTHPVIDIPSLRSLSIGHGSGTQMPHMLELLSTPSLEFLELMDFDVTEWNIFRRVVKDKTSEYSSLRSLRLLDVDVEELDVWLMDATPMITHLMVIDREFSQATVDLFLTALRDQAQATLRAGGLPCWSDLRILTLSHPDPALLQSVVSTRMDTGQPLSRLRLDRSFFSNMPLDWLQKHTSVEEIIIKEYTDGSSLPRHRIGECTDGRE